MRAIILCSLILISGCAPRGPLSPEEAYYGLRQACLQGDGEAVMTFLSVNTIQRMEHIIAEIRSLNEERLKALAGEMMTTPENLKTLTLPRFLSLQLSMEKSGPRAIIPFLQTKPAKITVHENRATLINEAGVMMKLVKEGPYWKFEEGVF